MTRSTATRPVSTRPAIISSRSWWIRDLPPNVGSYRPIRIHAPSGSCINAKSPAAIGNSTIITAPKVVDVLLGALVHAVPERAAAASNGVTSLFNIGGFNPRTGKLYNYIETYAGGQGAMHNQDGMDAVQCHMTNTRNAPVEVIESTYPLLVQKLRAGARLGRSRPLPGRPRDEAGDRNPESENDTNRQHRPIQIETLGCLRRDGGRKFCLFPRTSGREGGETGLFKDDDDPSKTGDVVTIMTPGAGGWEDPLTRDPEKVLWDVTEEFVSPERAKEFYGVVVEKKGYRRFEINHPETEAVRKDRQKVQNSRQQCTASK